MDETKTQTQKKRVPWSGSLTKAVAIVVSDHDYAVRIDRLAQALYPYLTSPASLDQSADGVSGSLSSSLHLPKTENVGSTAPEEVSEYAGNQTAA